MLHPLAPGDLSRTQSNTNLSSMASLSILDRNGNELSSSTDVAHPFEFLIPVDVNVALPPTALQHVTSSNGSNPHRQLFNFHYVNISRSDNLTVSVHFQIDALNNTLAYLMIYRFDSSPLLNSSINQIDGWLLLCPTSNRSNSSLYNQFIDNRRTAGHQSVIFGVRELNATEATRSCSRSPLSDPPISDAPFNFTSNYGIRAYTSGCYYLDRTFGWQSDGLQVGPSTNHRQTQCLSTHLTSFAGGFLVLPAPVNWSYVFANADFMKNKTIYLTVIGLGVLYIALTIYARFQDKKDIEKVSVCARDEHRWHSICVSFQLGVTPMADNHPRDGYFYQVIVFTGHRKDAGTDSKVRFATERCLMRRVRSRSGSPAHRRRAG